MSDYEEWRYVVGSPEYVVSNLGGLRRTGQRRGRVPGRRFSKDGDILVNLRYGPDQTEQKRLARLVADAFLPERPTNHPDIAFLDGDQTNCRADNLMWVKKET